MGSVQYLCAECNGTNFPEGMFIYHCPVCKMLMHPGCWEAHAARHQKQADITSDHLQPRRGKISVYGIIQWDK